MDLVNISETLSVNKSVNAIFENNYYVKCFEINNTKTPLTFKEAINLIPLLWRFNNTKLIYLDINNNVIELIFSIGKDCFTEEDWLDKTNWSLTKECN